MSLSTKDLLDIRTLPVHDIHLILDTAASFKEVSTRDIKKVPPLRGKTVIHFFVEPSTRTLSSFDIAAKRLSADTINVSGSSSSLVKGETLIDTAQNLQAMAADAIVIRHGASGAPHVIARHTDASIINAGDGAHEHPTQALLDAMTIIEKKGKIEGLKVAILGDIRHSRVARSNVHLLTKLGARVFVFGPRPLLPAEFDRITGECEGSLTIAPCIEEALEEADVVMVLRIQIERQKEAYFSSLREYAVQFGLSARRLAFADPNVIVLHPGPVNRGIEISTEVMESASSVILDQVTNGVAVRMAVLHLLINRGAPVTAASS